MPCALSVVHSCGACRFTPWVHLHGVMWSKWWLERNPEWQQLSKKWTPPMGGNAGGQGGVLVGQGLCHSKAISAVRLLPPASNTGSS